MASVDLATANGHIDIECLLRPLVDLDISGPISKIVDDKASKRPMQVFGGWD